MRRLIIIPFAALALLGATDANAHLMATKHCSTVSCVNDRQLQNLKHARYVCNYGAHQTKRWNCAAVKWLTREYKETEAVLHPRVLTSTHTLQQARNLADGCLEELVARESGWDPGKWNYGGSGAFGLPQALPYSKMPKAAWPKSAGGQEDPVVQVQWMQSYVGHYGGSCAALDFQKRNGYY